jgi:DnaJ homolog subfamily B member 6
MDRNLYAILGVERDATQEQSALSVSFPCDSPLTPYLVRRAYREKALQTHPDKLPLGASPAEKAASEDQFRRVCDSGLTLVCMALKWCHQIDQ